MEESVKESEEYILTIKYSNGVNSANVTTSTKGEITSVIALGMLEMAKNNILKHIQMTS